MTATGGPSNGHQTGVALSRHKTCEVKARALVASLLVLSLALALFTTNASVAARQSEGDGPTGFVNIALPPGGDVLVENRRGAVRIEVWPEGHVAVAAVVQGSTKAARRKLPVSIEHADGPLTIRVERATAVDSSRVDLKLRVPASARLKVFTSDGELRVTGLPVSLDAQTISGDMRLAIPTPTDASITAQSLNGSVAVGEGVESGGDGARTLRGKFQTRRGAGARSVNLFSGRGRISLSALAGDEPGVEAARAASRQPRVNEPQDERNFKPVAPKPQPVETPQEVGEDEVVRVESDLVTLNVSVVDRASGRGLVGLAAGDFRVYEDNVEQRVEHFESAEAPFDLLLLLDLSGSTARVTDTIRAAARRFVTATRTQARIAIITSAGETNVVSSPTSDRP